MKKLLLAGVAALVIAGGYFVVQHVQMNDHTEMQVLASSGNISISNASARFLLDNRPGGIFLTIHNKGDADRLVKATSPISERVELHTHINDNGVMKMRETEAIDIAANGVTEFKSGGYHIMIFDVAKKPEKGTTIALTLTFEKAGPVDLNVIVGDGTATHAH
jgi:copper(I)-binding protein